MPAPSQEELIALTTALIIDNNTMQISPYKLRQLVFALISAIAPTSAGAVNVVFPLLFNAFTNTFSLDSASIGEPLQPLEIRVFKKAPGNTGGFLKETGDLVYGEPVAGIIWNLARFDGGSDADINNYTVFSQTEIT